MAFSVPTPGETAAALVAHVVNTDRQNLDPGKSFPVHQRCEYTGYLQGKPHARHSLFAQERQRRKKVLVTSMPLRNGVGIYIAHLSAGLYTAGGSFGSPAWARRSEVIEIAGFGIR